MGGLISWFGFGGSSPQGELPDIFPIGMKQIDFLRIDVVNIYSKILTDVMERTSGMSDEQQTVLWDSCLKSDIPDGLITRLAKAMSDKHELFLVYDKATKLLRLANSTEQSQITTDYAKQASSNVGVFVSFQNYLRSDMIKLYSALEYCTVSSLHKSMNLSKAIQIKINDLRASVSLADSADAKTQAKDVALSLANGRDVMLDSKDTLETAAPDLTAVKAAMDFLDAKRSFYLGLPASYINGEQTGGLGTTGENDTKAIERGLKSYFESIMKPVIFALFGVKLVYKSQDFRQVAQGLEALKTFVLVGEDHLTIDNQKRIVEGLFDVDPDENKDTTIPLEPQPAPTGVPPAGNQPVPPPKGGNA